MVRSGDILNCHNRGTLLSSHVQRAEMPPEFHRAQQSPLAPNQPVINSFKAEEKNIKNKEKLV